MPKIVQVIPYMDPTAGGPPIVVDKLAKSATGNGWVTEVFTTPEFTSDKADALIRSSKNAYRVDLVDRQTSALFGRIKEKVGKAVANADLVHLHTMWSPLNLAFARACLKGERTPYILSPHGMLDPYSLGVSRYKKHLYLQLFERKVINNADRVLFTSREECNRTIDGLGYAPKSSIVPLGADAPPSPVGDLANNFVRSYPELSDRSLLIFMGRLHPKKRLDLVLKSLPQIVKRLPNVTLLIVGSGEAAYERELQSLVERLGLVRNVRFLGFLTGQKKWEALAASKAFLLPSHQENFGIAVGEALQAGVPVILSRAVNIWKEVVDAGAGLVVLEDNAEADLSKCILDVLTQDEVRTEMVKKAGLLAKSKFSWPSSVQNTYKIYDAVIENRLSK